MSRENGSKARGVAIVALAYVVGLAVALGVGWALRGAHPLVVVALADLAATVAVFCFSVGTNNSSMYDPYWSVAPIVIVSYHGLRPVSPEVDPLRLALVAGLVALWGLRLTWNWLRGWSGLDHEDWRYVDIRAKSGKFHWPASFVAVHLLPTVFVYLGCLSLYVAGSAGSRPIGVLDGIAAVVTAGAILIEATADKQLHRFVASGPERGAVLDQGLWAWSRHPNYFGEVLFWWGLYLFAVAASPSSWWTVAGPVAITCLFLFISIPLIDKRMLHRRGTAYAERMRRVSVLVPWFPKR